jgi:hypothetical protein
MSERADYPRFMSDPATLVATLTTVASMSSVAKIAAKILIELRRATRGDLERLAAESASLTDRDAIRGGVDEALKKLETGGLIVKIGEAPVDEGRSYGLSQRGFEILSEPNVRQALSAR